MKLWRFEFPLKRNNIATGGVEEKEGFIVRTPPILNKFRGQPLINLHRWINSINGTLTEIK